MADATTDPKDAARPAIGRETASQGEPSTPTAAADDTGGPGGIVRNRGGIINDTPESRAVSAGHKAVLTVLEATGIRDGADLDALEQIMRTSPVERNRLRAAEVLAANRMAAARLAKEGSGPTIDARSVTLNLTTGTRPTAEDVREALRMLAEGGAL